MSMQMPNDDREPKPGDDCQGGQAADDSKAAEKLAGELPPVQSVRVFNIKWAVEPGTITGYWYHGYKNKDHWIDLRAEELPTELTCLNWDGTDPKTLVEQDYPSMLTFDVEIIPGCPGDDGPAGQES